jgi:Gpi18-like mannosyltransferase
MSDALFLLLNIAAVYACRKESWAAAGLLGLLAALCRLPGVLLAIPAGVEAVHQLLRMTRAGGPVKAALRTRAAGVLLVPLGTGIYLLMNKIVTGNPLQFLIYQREHWQQRAGLPFDTLSYMTRNAINWAQSDPGMFWDISLPHLIALPAALILLFLGAKRLRPGYALYSLAYVYVALAPTWLLSGPRYLAALFTLPAALAPLLRRKWADAALSALCAVGFALYLLRFISGGLVY